VKIVLFLCLTMFFVSCEFDKGSGDDKKVKPNRQQERDSEEDSPPAPTTVEVPAEPKPPVGGPPMSLPICEEVCDKKSSIIKSNIRGFSYLGFANFGYRGVGRCRGHALFTQRMSILGKFKSSGGCDVNEPACIQNLLTGIQKIIEFKPHVFNGYRSLYDLSLVPEIQQYIYDHIKFVDHRYNAGPGKVRNRHFTSRALNVFYELEARTNSGQLPYVGVIGRLTGSHALLIYKTEYIGNRDVLCARDPNIVLGYREDCQSYFYIEKGQVYYKRFDRLSDYMQKFELTSDEDRRVKIYTNSLYKQCLQEKRDRNECK
jgi:hypothetical protein